MTKYYKWTCAKITEPHLLFKYFKVDDQGRYSAFLIKEQKWDRPQQPAVDYARNHGEEISEKECFVNIL